MAQEEKDLVSNMLRKLRAIWKAIIADQYEETVSNLNLAEILKNCPKGMKLYSPLCGECILDHVEDSKYAIVVETVRDMWRRQFTFTAEGRYIDLVDAECLLFPSKDQRNWSNFQRPS